MKQLYLYNNQIMTIPPEIGYLPSLNYLDMSKNLLTSIPPEIGDLPSLETLKLSNNQITTIPIEIGYLTNLRNLRLQGNLITGLAPIELLDLLNLENDANDFRWNALYTSNQLVVNFLNIKQEGGDWQSTQTIKPTDLEANSPAENSVALTWSSISYTADTGGYEVYYSTDSGGPYTLFEETSDKTIENSTITGLSSCADYFFTLRTVTYDHQNNPNTVYSEFTDEVSENTTTSNDTDSDGTNDCDDECINDPNKIAPGTCGCGVAETDSDDDGTPDCVDFQPIASITSPVSDLTIEVGNSINFQCSVSDGNAPYTYSWDFDGAAANSTQQYPSAITFNEAGSFTITLAVADSDGDIDTDLIIITVEDDSGGDNGGGGGPCFIGALPK